MKVDALVVGCGLSGSTCARVLAERGYIVEIIDKRNHVGGTARDHHDEHGVLIHDYGPHIFHTNSERIWNFLSQFTEWNGYVHRVLAEYSGEYYPMPINRTTINKLYGWDLSESDVEEYLRSVQDTRDMNTSEDYVLNTVGSDLCERFFRGYTQKQWNADLSELLPTVAARIPVRTNDDDRYFTDRYQGVPRDGYTRMFERMLNHPNIHIRLNTTFQDYSGSYNRLVYTGPIDEYYGYRYGELPYRSIRFETVHYPDTERILPAGAVNYSSMEYAYTRATEYKQLTLQQHSGTTVMWEYPCSDGDKHYPIPTPQNDALSKRYHDLAAQESNVYFVGRLGQYRYYNMDQVVASALATCDRIV